MTFLSRFRVMVVVLAVLPLSGCLFRSRKVERQYSTAPLKTATQAQLLARLADLNADEFALFSLDPEPDFEHKSTNAFVNHAVLGQIKIKYL